MNDIDRLMRLRATRPAGDVIWEGVSALRDGLSNAVVGYDGRLLLRDRTPGLAPIMPPWRLELEYVE